MSKLCRLLCIAVWLSVLSWTASAQEHLPGDWNGQLDTPVGKLSLLIHLSGSAATGFSGDLESVDQAPGQKIPLAAISATADKLSFTVPAIGASYDGAWQ